MIQPIGLRATSCTAETLWTKAEHRCAMCAGTVKGFVPEKVRNGIAGGASKSRIPSAVGKSTNVILPSSVSATRSAIPQSMSKHLGEDPQRRQDIPCYIHHKSCHLSIRVWACCPPAVAANLDSALSARLSCDAFFLKASNGGGCSSRSDLSGSILVRLITLLWKVQGIMRLSS